MSFNCKYCKKNFTSLGNLTKHQKTTKYCLKIQSENNVVNKDETIHKCNYCRKDISKYHLEKHMQSCLSKYQHIIDFVEKKYKDSISELKETLLKTNDENLKLKERNIAVETEVRILREQNERSTTTVEEIAKQPRINASTTNNNNQKVLINTPMDMSISTLNQAIQNGFSDEYLIHGQKGVARFAYDNILKDEQGKLKYVCTDAARQIFQYKNEDGSMQKDVRATKLTKALLDSELKSASHKIASDKMKDNNPEEFNSYTNNYFEINDLETNNSNFSKELSTLVV